MSLLNSLSQDSQDRWEAWEGESPWENGVAKYWEKLTLALAKASRTMFNPPPNYGLVALWLRVVCRKAHEVEKAASESGNGYDHVVRTRPDCFRWLLYFACFVGRKLLKFYPEIAQPLGLLANPTIDQDPIRELNKLANTTEKLLRDRRGGSACSGSIPLDDETMVGLQGCGAEAGRLILALLDGRYLANDETLDEIVLFALGLNKELVDKDLVFRVLAALWLPGSWDGFPPEYCKAIISEKKYEVDLEIDFAKYPSYMRDIADRLAATESESVVSAANNAQSEDWSKIIIVDPVQDIVSVDGNSHVVTAEQKRMMQLLVEANGHYIAMSKTDFSKPSKLKNGLPEQLRHLIESESGKGYRLVRRNSGALRA